VEVLAAGICGTDLHIEDDEFPSSPPVTMGHEVTGEVAEIGASVDRAWLGARVALETYFHYCGACRQCRDGFPNLCAERLSIGSRVDGGFARWITIPVRNLHRVPDSVGRYAGALCEPLACVAQCLFNPTVVHAGDRVLVTGPGTMGLLTAQAARAAGGEAVVAGLPRDRERLAVADSLGFDTHEVTDSGAAWGGSFDVVCECSGADAAAALALQAVAERGHYVQVGIFGRRIEFDLDTVLYKELVVTSGNASTPASWEQAMALLGEEAVQLDPLVTEVVPLVEWERAFAATRSGEGVKYVIDPRPGE
jgi:L-iditol 2-dehydrogenase